MSLSAFPYPGGKTRFVDEIRERLPDHQTYVEPFGGSAAVLLNKPESYTEVFNDLNSDIVHFFRVLREQPDELREWLEKVPYSRELHGRWADRFYAGHRPTDDVIRAGQWFYLRYTQYGGKIATKSGFKASTCRNEARSYRGAVDGLEEIRDRFQHVNLECRDCEAIIGQYDDSETVFYFDPPYYGKEAFYDTGGFDHAAFVDNLTDIEGRWLCSYGELPPSMAEAVDANGWHVTSYDVHYSLDVQKADDAEPSTERLVLNYDPADVVPFRPTQQTGLESYGGEGR